MTSLVQSTARIAAWGCIALIVFATLSPIQARPHLASQGIEHFAAFALTAALFSIAYPRRIGLVLAIVLMAAIGLELAQLVLPDRHARLIDVLRKCIGGTAGAGLGYALTRVMERMGFAAPIGRAPGPMQ